MPATTPEERLFTIYDAYRQAFKRRSKDWKEAKTMAQAEAIFRNVQRLELLYLKAARQALTNNNAAVEAAHADAKTAKQDVEKAYDNEKALVERIGLVGTLGSKIADLLAKAG